MGKGKQQQAAKATTETKKKGSIVNKILGALVVVLLAVNIQLYIQKYQLTSNVEVKVHRSADGSHIAVNYNTQFIKDAGVYKVLQEVNYNSAVQGLDLQFSMNSLSKLDIVTDKLSQFTKIRNLTLNVGTNPIGNSSVDTLISSLQQFTNLQYLDLGIDGLFNKDGRDRLFETIASLPQLVHLKLSLIHTDLSGENLQSLRRLEKLTNLKTLHLVMVGSKVGPKESEILGAFIAHLPKLDDLVVNLYANKIQSDGASHLASGLFHQKQLTKFQLELFFNNVSLVGTESLTGAVSGMTKLEELKFSLEFNYITDEGGVQVAEMLKKLPEIRVLNLNLATKNFGRIGYQEVILALHKLNRLNELVLNIGVNKCGVIGAEELKHLLVRHNKLRILKFNYLENYVGDIGAKHIADGIRAQQNLEELQVVMSFNSLTDYGALEITKAVQEAKSPKLIDLRLTQNEITDQGALEVFQLVESTLPRVQHFELEYLNTALTNATRDVLLEKYQDKHANFELRINTIPPSNWEKTE